MGRINIQELISHKDGLYEIVMVFDIKMEAPKDLIQEAKRYYNADTVLKANGKIYFCRKVVDVPENEIEYINEV